MGKKAKVLVAWIIVLVLAILVLQMLGRGDSLDEAQYSTFLEHVENDEVEAILIQGGSLIVTLKDSGHTYTTNGWVGEDLIKELHAKGVAVDYGEEKGSKTWLWCLLPVLLILVLFFYFVRKQQGTVGNVFSLGRSRARRVTEHSVKFEHVGGAVDAKEHFADIIDYLRHPKRWEEAGVRLPRGVLLIGPPGCGKTLLARAVSGEAGVPFFSISASEFVELFVGVGAARVRDMFDQAKKEAPAVIFIDELDAVGRRRGSGIGSAHDEREQTLNQLLVSLDGFEENDHVVVIAATNRPDVLDKALLRPGRFDLRIQVDVPREEFRLEILRIHTANKRLGDDVELEEIARRTAGLTGADLETIANEAALFAVRRARQNGSSEVPRISAEDFQRAVHAVAAKERIFSQLDSVLLESATQLAQPTGKVFVQVTTKDDSTIEGQLLWADGGFLKIARDPQDGEPITDDVIVPKMQLKSVRALPGTEMAAAGDVVGDRWAHRVSETM